jgi:predicted O-methyltransferase YrrM
MPWWSFRAIERADMLITGKRMFEYGTGGSTLRFSRIAQQVVCVEDDAAWAQVVKERLAKESINNVEMRLCPFDFKNPSHFEESAYIAAVDDGIWDVVIIDGQDWTFKERLACFRRVEPMMKPGAIIIVDDFWRYEDLLKSTRAKSVEIYESVGPARYGVTSTAFFFYA